MAPSGEKSVEIIYATLSGPNGRAEVYEISEVLIDRTLPDSLHGGRPVDVHFEVRFGTERQSLFTESEAMLTAQELVGRTTRFRT